MISTYAIDYGIMNFGVVMIALSEIRDEWPEIYGIIKKLATGEELSKQDELWLSELAGVSGWDREDVIDDLMNLNIDPSRRAERYLSLFRKYYSEALDFAKQRNTTQAGEKIWGAVTSLIKYYAAIKNVPMMHWSRSRLERFITNQLPKNQRKLFRRLLDKAHVLHEHFYERHLDDETFRERWRELLDLIKRAKKIIEKALK